MTEDEEWKLQILIFMEIMRAHFEEDAAAKGIDTVHHGPTTADQIEAIIGILTDD